MEKEEVKGVIKELFKEGSITIKVDQVDDYGSRYLVTTVYINEEVVAEDRNYIGSNGRTY